MAEPNTGADHQPAQRLTLNPCFLRSLRGRSRKDADRHAPLPDIAHLDAHLAEAEARVAGVRPGCESRIIWAGAPGVKTPYTLLYIHGFSASPQEIRPVPDLVAAELGVNLYFPRLTGHGQDGEALAASGLDDWMRDVAEAVKVAQMIGNEIIIMACSNGCTLATLALARGLRAKAAIYISPHFRMRKKVVQFLLDAPASRLWAPYITGRIYSLYTISDAHRAYWTTTYPITATHQMGRCLRAVRKTKLSHITTPMFLSLNEADRVSDPRDMRKVAARWGGPVTMDLLTPGPDDDWLGHVMAGDVFSPAQTVPMAGRIGDWLDTVLTDPCGTAAPASGYAAE